jgi:hypothetical protein
LPPRGKGCWQGMHCQLGVSREEELGWSFDGNGHGGGFGLLMERRTSDDDDGRMAACSGDWSFEQRIYVSVSGRNSGFRFLNRSVPDIFARSWFPVTVRLLWPHVTVALLILHRN